jgi:hypothetical protein
MIGATIALASRTRGELWLREIASRQLAHRRRLRENTEY